MSLYARENSSQRTNKCASLRDEVVAHVALCVKRSVKSTRATQLSSWDLYYWKPCCLVPLIRLSVKRGGDAKAGPGAVSPSLRWSALQSAIRREPKSVQPAFPYADPLLPSMCVSETDWERESRTPATLHLKIFTGFVWSKDDHINKKIK